MSTSNYDQISQLKNLFLENNFHPKKLFGQNFLVDKNYIKNMLEATCPINGDLLLEVGPGGGILTRALIQTQLPVLSIEIDDMIVQMAKELFGDHANFQLLHADIMSKKNQINPIVVEKINAIQPKTIKCVANLPYAIITPFLITMLSTFPQLESFTILIQKEIADKICANISSNDYGILSVVMQLWGNNKILKIVPPQSFWPQPKINSAIIHSQKKENLTDFNFHEFSFFIKNMFQQRRKKVTHPLKNYIENPDFLLSKIGISSDYRPENLSPEQWQSLFIEISKNSQRSSFNSSDSEEVSEED